MYFKTTCTAAAVILTAGILFGQATPERRPPSVRYGFTLMRQDAAQIHGSGAGPGSFLGMRFYAWRDMFVTAGVGFYQATDDFMTWENRYAELKPALEAKAGFSLPAMDRIVPYIDAGLMLSYYVLYEKDLELNIETTREVNLGLILGGGITYNFFRTISFYVEGEYRQDFLSKNDWKHTYWVASTGLMFELRPSLFTPEETPDDFLALARKEQDLFDGIFKDRYVQDPEFREFFASLEKAEEETYPDGIEREATVADPIFDIIGDVVISNELADLGMQYQEFLDDPDAALDFKEGYRQGLQLFSLGKFYEAAHVFAYLIKHHPGSPVLSNCYYWIGRCYYAQKKYDQALLAFKYTVTEEVSSKYPAAFYFSGLCLLATGQREKAKMFFLEYIRRFPDDEYAARIKAYMESH